MHKAWSCLGEVAYCFSRSSVKFQGHTAQKVSIFTQIRCFRTVTPGWIHQWLWNDAQSLKQHRRGCPIVFQGHPSNFKSHGTKIADFDPNLAFPDCNFSLNVTMAMKWMHKAWRNIRGPLLFFKVIRQISRSHRAINHRFWPELSFSGL